MGELLFSLETDASGPILKIKISGQASNKNASEIARQTHEIIKDHEHGLICVDVRDIQGRLDLFETYAHVRDYMPDAPRRKTAVIELAANVRHYTFFETVSVNRGQHLRVFTDPCAAEAWLFDKQ